jgi:hypothetical protein
MLKLTVGYVAGMVALGIFIGELSLATSTKIRIMWVARGVWPTQFNWLVLIHNSRTQDNVARDSAFIVLLFHFADSIPAQAWCPNALMFFLSGLLHDQETATTW